jgi:hypothetical protein
MGPGLRQDDSSLFFQPNALRRCVVLVASGYGGVGVRHRCLAKRLIEAMTRLAEDRFWSLLDMGSVLLPDTREQRQTGAI